MVVGDVNSTLACALTAVKLGVPVAHVEAGLRSFDRSMPEEINRILTDAISDWLFVTEPSGLANLRTENVPGERVHFVGNVMIDTLIACQPRIAAVADPRHARRLAPGSYAVLTMHRPANVDRPEVFAGLMAAIARLQREMPFVFPVHPRTRKAITAASARAVAQPDFHGAARLSRFHEADRPGPLRADRFGRRAGRDDLAWRAVLDDARKHRTPDHRHAGNQSTGRPECRNASSRRVCTLLPRRQARGTIPELWDGHAAKRILDVLTKKNATIKPRQEATAEMFFS